MIFKKKFKVLLKKTKDCFLEIEALDINDAKFIATEISGETEFSKIVVKEIR